MPQEDIRPFRPLSGRDSCVGKSIHATRYTDCFYRMPQIFPSADPHLAIRGYLYLMAQMAFISIKTRLRTQIQARC